MKAHWRLLLVAASMVLMMMSGIARAEEIPIVTGEQWARYLVGIANIVQVEIAFEGANPVSDMQSILPRMVKGMKGQTLDGVREALNKWYAAHPERMQRPVIETIWFELVVPGLKKST